MLAALSDRPKFLVLVLLGAGMRISESLGMRWMDIDFDKGTLKIRRLR
jgi:integrase